jgi:hypothetical protein
MHALVPLLALAAAAVGAPVPAESGAPVQVHIESDAPNTQLVRVAPNPAAGSRNEWSGSSAFPIECNAPCDRMLVPSGKFYIAGDGIPESHPFNLEGHGYDVTLKVKAGSPGWRNFGTSLSLAGGALFLADGYYTLPASQQVKASFTATQWWTLLASLVLEVGGFALAAASQTFVEVVEAEPTTPEENAEDSSTSGADNL